MRIIIVGCGKVGTTLIEQLSREGHDITIIDRSAKLVQTLTDLYDVMGIVGNGASYSVQMEAGIENADLLIAVTESDELNLLCCTVAKRVGDCAAIARVRTPDYSTEVGYLRDKLELAMIINPELEAANEVARILYLPTALEVNSFAHGQAELIKFKIPDGNMLDNISIAHLGKNIAHNVLICAVERDGEVYIPSGNFTLKKDDVLSFVASRKAGKDFLETIGFKTNHVKSTMIIGGGKAAYYLARQLLKMGISVKIIEIDKARCEEPSILLPKAIIINGDGTNEALLKEEGIEYTESFVPLTGIDETVVLLSKGEIDSKKVRVEFSLEDMDMSEFQDGATYPQIKEYVLEHTGLKVSNLYISQIKRKCGLEVGKNYNLPKSEDSRQPQCPPEKEKAIREAFKYFGMI